MLFREVFRNPPAEYRPIPFWFWNCRLRKPEIERQIRDFHEKGLGGFFIHARFGLETPYLSDEWIDLIECAVQIAAELGMEVWLYDENAFPSGVGDLRISSIPEYRPRFIDLEETSESKINGDVLLSIRRDSGYVHFVKRVIEDANDVVFGVDYLSKEAMSKFFEITLEPYKAALGRHFGETIKGIFTDEPVLLPWHHDINWYGRLSDTKVVVWDDQIPVQMKQRFGMEIADFLPHLFYDIDGSTPETRRRFWRVVSDLFVGAFFGPYSKWCEANNLKLTGHVLFEEGLFLNTDFQSDIVENLRRMDIPGTDHLGMCTEVAYGGFSNTPKMLTNIQGEKLVTSISHIYGKTACISETFGCAGWGLTPERMKWMVDWQYTLGVNMLCPHALFYSIEGFRKSDAPPSQNHMTFWNDHRLFADYAGRLSYVLRQGKHLAKVAVEYPLEKFWGLHRIGDASEEERILSDQYDEICSTLVRRCVDYDTIPTSEIRQERVIDGRLRIGNEDYEHLVVFRNSPVEGMPITTVGPEPGIADVDFCSLPTAVDADYPSGALQCIQREVGPERVFFFTNTSGEECPARITVDCSGKIEKWDAETGEVREVPGAASFDGRITVSEHLPPYGSTLYVIDTSSRFGDAAPSTEAGQEVLAEIREWRFRPLTLNALPLNRLEMCMRTHGAGTDYLYSTQVETDAVPSRLRLLLDDVEYRSSLMGKMDVAVIVNDQEIAHLEPWEVDPHMKTVDVGSAFRVGNNYVAIRIRHSSWSGQPLVLNSIPVLLGDFVVASPEPPYRIGVPVGRAGVGSWTEIGFPFLSGTASYGATVELPDVAGRPVWIEAAEIADTVAFVINGQKVATRLWRPWKAEITRCVKPGPNEIELCVTNSMQNMLERSPRRSGLLSAARVVAEG